MRGHRWDDLLEYTLGQLTGFVEAAKRQDALEDQRLLTLMSLATRGDHDALDRTLARLTTLIEGD